MRAYAKFSPRFWVQGSGRRLRGDAEAQALAAHLLTGPSSTMIGLYYLPIPVLAHELGWSIEAATKALDRVCAAGFASYDPSKELVWVFNAAKIEFGNGLSIGDRRCKGITKQLLQFGNHPFVQGFLYTYGDAYNLLGCGVVPAPLPAHSQDLTSPFEGAPIRDRSRYQEQGEQRPSKPLPPLTDSLRDLQLPERREASLAVARKLHEHWCAEMVRLKRTTTRPEMFPSPAQLADIAIVLGNADGDYDRAARAVTAMVASNDPHWAKRKWILPVLKNSEQYSQAEAEAAEVPTPKPAALTGDEKHRRYEQRRLAEEARIEARNAAADEARAAATERGEPFNLDAFEAEWDRTQAPKRVGAA